MQRWRVSFLRSRPNARWLRRTARKTRPKPTCSITSSASIIPSGGTRRGAISVRWSSKGRRNSRKLLPTKPAAAQKEEHMSKLRVGYILDDSNQSSLVYDLIERSKNSKFYSIELLVIQKSLRTEAKGLIGRLLDYAKTRGVKKLIERILFTIIVRAENILVIQNPKYSAHFRSYSLDTIQVERLYVEPIISKSGFVYRYSQEDLQELKKKNLDVLIRGGSGILRGEILSLCRYGVVSFHHANNDINRGGVPGFWEVLNREPSTGFIIQRLFDELDGGDVLFKGGIATSSFYILNLVNLYLKANIFMHLF